ncbi:MAG: ribonuclease H-like domain-containing protein [Chloroflexi bacterium]|nr:ribonuclease H-like domain-containing protein [Chloroflexota bacterium]
MNADIRDRLRRLGVHKGVGHLKPRPVTLSRTGLSDADREQEVELDLSHGSPPSEPIDPDAPLWNLELTTTYGNAFVRRTVFPLDHQHGGCPLDHALAQPSPLLTRLCGGNALDLREAIFLDTETTGLAGGTGTLVFLIGVGYFAGNDGRLAEGYGAEDAQHPSSFVVDQYFLPDPVHEAAMLGALDEHLTRYHALVTFNGRGFDVPLLETRFTLARIAPSLSDHVHLDLLMPARRTWRVDVGSCSLSSLEHHVLGVRRDQQDIPGFLIPHLYREYLHSHDPADMQRVMYHNLYDILSMVTLVPRLCGAISTPRNPGEYLAAGVFHENARQLREAEAIYRTALAAQATQQHTFGLAYQRIAQRLANCLKQQDRRAEAVPYWQQLADAGDVDAVLELAKHYEWCEVDLPQALSYATRALTLSQDAFTRGQVNHRVQRLTRKLNRQQQTRDGSSEAG